MHSHWYTSHQLNNNVSSAKADELMSLCDKLEEVRTKREKNRIQLTTASLAPLNEPNQETFQEDVRFVIKTVSSLTARPEQVKRLRQSILNLAVRGNTCATGSKR